MSSQSLEQTHLTLDRFFQTQPQEILEKIKKINKILQGRKHLSKAQKSFYCKEERKYMKLYLKRLI
ncbi:MAG: hypothetical protein R6U96_16280 [Promethearchaeia archaeon]